MSPYTKKVTNKVGSKFWDENVHLPCGKCVECKKRRVSEWVFRLEQEDLSSTSSLFVTLTFDNKYVPMSPKGYMTLPYKEDRVINKGKNKGKTKKVPSEYHMESFIKRLRYYQNGSKKSKIKYYGVGEYGSKTNRPHWHLIIFNVNDKEDIHKAWPYGTVHVGNVSGDSIAYTCKYIDKPSRIPVHINDDRVPEYSRMSQGLGDRFLTPAMIRYFKADYSRNFITLKDGKKIPLPRYYRKKIFKEGTKEYYESMLFNRRNIKKIQDEGYEKAKREFEKIYGKREGYIFEDWLAANKKGKELKFYKSLKTREL